METQSSLTQVRGMVGGGWGVREHQRLTSHLVCTVAGCVNFSFAYVEGESLLMAMKDVALSSGR